MDKLDLNMKEVHKELVDFLKENFKKNGFSKAVLGLSGGIDSALAAYLLRDALGKENVLAIMMPYKSSNPDSLNHAKLVVEDLGINSKVIEITDNNGNSRIELKEESLNSINLFDKTYIIIRNSN